MWLNFEAVVCHGVACCLRSDRPKPTASSCCHVNRWLRSLKDKRNSGCSCEGHLTAETNRSILRRLWPQSEQVLKQRSEMSRICLHLFVGAEALFQRKPGSHSRSRVLVYVLVVQSRPSLATDAVFQTQSFMECVAFLFVTHTHTQSQLFASKHCHVGASCVWKCLKIRPVL